ncbi:MAG TPA: CDP-diacylglycerol--serine O-phosphatidyltransferase [Rhizomicrobium sp.]|jgi:CDP-diacylglycerol--serine O-phosphatidyltransferase|nr:CDP-diacylglycerol--serine O-phosphatidyltransferase [Rhizomicrobium sp.]
MSLDEFRGEKVKPPRGTRRARARQMVAARLEKLEDLSISKLVPSTLTLLGLASGATAIRFALLGNWTSAVAAVVFAMIFDMLDGRAARLLGADTRFGAQLDSLADLVSFGMAPGIIMYSWSLSRMGVAGWIATLIFCAASAIRLARFNVQSVRDEGATKADPYFTGLPTPAAACMMLLPLVISFQWGAGEPGLSEIVRAPWLVLTMTAITSVMMVSRLPTPSIKYMRLSREHRVIVGFCGGLLAALLIEWPWATLTGILLVYVATIPVAVYVHHPRAQAMRAAKSTHNS